MDLYAILLVFVTELTNYKTEPAVEQRFTQVVLLDQPGFHTRAASSSATLVRQHGQNGFDEFAIHFRYDLVQAHVFARVFDEQAPEGVQMARDVISVPSVVTVDNAACVELLRGLRERGLVKPNGVAGTISRSLTAFRQGKLSTSSVGGGDDLVTRSRWRIRDVLELSHGPARPAVLALKKDGHASGLVNVLDVVLKSFGVAKTFAFAPSRGMANILSSPCNTALYLRPASVLGHVSAVSESL
ncbi:hypothetical protein EXIGLDRAFT_228981 [Exidia glandulosa HHB12029]|uniref:Uncharacterized protein n=1 Tax=Exidia glandulosa HHB12029 TaxID=1314781 RepID=A0A165E7S6_EXIGL|nr:hypothetical protein EXIGLDRAFT_228981 [Exidia glandulosa HHB12029]